MQLSPILGYTGQYAHTERRVCEYNDVLGGVVVLKNKADCN